MAQAMSGLRRRWVVVVGAVLLVGVLVLNFMSGFYVDLLWFREVGFGAVFWRVFWTKVLLGVTAGGLFFALLYANLLIVRRVAPPYRVLSPEQEVIERYRVAVEPYAKWILPGLSAVIAVAVGVASSGRWQEFLMWRHSGGIEFQGGDEAVFGRNPAFYVFKLPFLHFVQGWLFSALVGVAILTAAGHYLYGGIRMQSVGERVTPQVRGHMSVLLGLIMLTKAWGYYLGRFDLLGSERGVVHGASYTDVHAQLPALTLLVVASAICAVLFLINVRFRVWALPVIGLGLLVLTSVVAGGIFPAAIQRFSVAPQELQREEEFIGRNIDATREAFALDETYITTERPSVDDELTQDDIEANQTTISNIRLWDPDILKLNYDQLQRIRQYYEFADVDVDRYTLGGERRMVMFSAREVSQNGVEAGGTWQNRHLFYTHGFGAVASQVNSAAPDGGPSFILRDIPPVGGLQGETGLSEDGQRIYYGELEDVPYVLVNSGVRELDYQGAPGDENKEFTNTYAGQGGIKVGGILGKALFAWRFKDVNLLISGLVKNDSRVLLYRNIEQRIPKAAPFLQYDGDPYAAIVDGRIVWIQDAYTTTGAYPYSQHMELDRNSTPGGRVVGSINYIRNSVKVVVDAYDGAITYYVADPTDPIIQVWRSVFPELFTPMEAASADLRSHFRYPEDLLFIQAQQYTNYHVTSAEVFYGKQDFWSVPLDPTFNANAENTEAQRVRVALRPYYVLLRLPGEETERFLLIMPLTPSERNNMVAYLAAISDPEGYGDVISFEFPAGQNVDGPIQVFNRINSNREFSSERTLLGQGGSSVRFGNFLTIPIGDSFLYVQPVFVQSNQEGAFPELKRVVVVHGDSVGIGNDLADAIADSFGEEPVEPPDGEEPVEPPGGTIEEQIAALLDQAIEHFAKAELALREGDLATYQSEIDLAQQLIERANELAKENGGEPVVTPSPGETPTPIPSSSGG